jgi:Heterokaryon incompatibility protein (HET)
VQGLPSYLSQLPKSTNSDASFNIAKDWLTECVQNHVNCRFRTFDLAALPSRLLDVDLGPNSETVRVEDTVELGFGVQYLALSHCWGSVATIKLTSKSLERCYFSISVDELPKTFRDAVSITRRLGFRYLWIDSLCIIQDLEKDWKCESAKMGSIYRNSTCCIAAVAARDSEGGCFSLRNPTHHFTCNLGRSGNNELFVVSDPNTSQFDYSNGFFDRN